LFFFFQAEDGIRDFHVTGVQTCALPISGEHVFAWHFADCPDLAPYREVAQILADHPWPRLYDPDALAAADVPVAAAVYADDPYVDRTFSEETAALLPDARLWVNDHLHNALRVAGEEVLDRLIGMVRG